MSVLELWIVMMIRKCPHEHEVAYDIVRIHSLMIYSDLVEYTNAGDTKLPCYDAFPLSQS